MYVKYLSDICWAFCPGSGGVHLDRRGKVERLDILNLQTEPCLRDLIRGVLLRSKQKLLTVSITWLAPTIYRGWIFLPWVTNSMMVGWETPSFRANRLTPRFSASVLALIFRTNSMEPLGCRVYTITDIVVDIISGFVGVWTIFMTWCVLLVEASTAEEERWNRNKNAAFRVRGAP